MVWRFYPISQFDTFSNTWQEINVKGFSVPIVSSSFVKLLILSFSSGQEVIAICEDSGRPAAMAILNRTGRCSWQTFQPSQAPIGMWIHDPAITLSYLLRTLLKALPDFPLIIGITQQDPERVARPDGNGRLRTLDYITTGRTLVKGSFEDYWCARDKEIRHEIKRRLKRLRETGIEPRLEIMRTATGVAKLIEQYGDIESAGWKGKQGTAVHTDNEQGAFYKAVGEEFGRQGHGRIYSYLFGDKVVAMQLCIEKNGCLVFLKTTYDENYRNYSPGILLRRAIYEQIFNEKEIAKIEIYGKIGVQGKWIDEMRTMYQINYYRWGSLAKLDSMRRARIEMSRLSDESGAVD